MLGLFYFLTSRLFRRQIPARFSQTVKTWGKVVSHRIEIIFVGNAPADELERARILANAGVTEAMADLSRALEAAGFAHEVGAKTVRTGERQGRPSRPVAAPIAAE